MEQNLKTLEEALRVAYLPALQNQLSTEPAAILSKIKQTECMGEYVETTAPIGLTGGFGYGAEGVPTPIAGPQRYERFRTVTKDLYVNIEISEKTVTLGNKSKAALVNALDAEIKGGYATAKWNVGRSIYGNGTGILTTCSAANNTTSVTVEDTKNLKEGLIVDFYATDAMPGDAPTVSAARIRAVDRANKKVILYDAVTVGAGFITVQNSYGREITGIGAIFDPTVTSIYGISKADNPFLVPEEYNAGNDIHDGIITEALRASDDYHNGEVDTLICGNGAYDAYVAYLRTNNVRVENKELKGGFRAISFDYGKRAVDVINESFVPSGEIWGIDCKSLELQTVGWDFARAKDGSAFNLVPGTSTHRALLRNYGDLICKNPGACFRIYYADVATA